MNWKELAKNVPVLYWINAKIKCYELKSGLSLLSQQYNEKARISGFNYDANLAILAFKARHLRYCPNYKPISKGKLNIFWVGANQCQDESGLLQGLQGLGKVTIFHNEKGNYGLWDGNELINSKLHFATIRQSNDNALLKQVSNTKNSGGIDVLIGQMWANLISKEALSKIQNMGIPVINIAMDDRLPIHWSIQDGDRLGSIGLFPGIDMALTTTFETCKWYGIEGCPALFWPLASDPKLFTPIQGAKRDIEVLFIGNRYGIRGQIVSYLKSNRINVTCYGSGWPNGYVKAEQNIALSKRAQIILGVGTVGHCSDVYTLKLRDFDAMMTGALYITHRNPDLCRIFTEGKEIEYYQSPKEAVKKILYYLDQSKERELIGYNGQQNAIKNHSWENRLSSTFSQLGILSN